MMVLCTSVRGEAVLECKLFPVNPINASYPMRLELKGVLARSLKSIVVSSKSLQDQQSANFLIFSHSFPGYSSVNPFSYREHISPQRQYERSGFVNWQELTEMRRFMTQMEL